MILKSLNMDRASDQFGSTSQDYGLVCVPRCSLRHRSIGLCTTAVIEWENYFSNFALTERELLTKDEIFDLG